MLVAICVAAEASLPPQPSRHSLRQLMTATQAAPADPLASSASLKIDITQCSIIRVFVQKCPPGQVVACCSDAGGCYPMYDLNTFLEPAGMKKQCDTAPNFRGCCPEPAVTGRK